MIDILIIDDMLWIRESIECMLSEYTEEINIIASVSDGEEALAILESIQPHLVITDISMPKMDGLEFAKRLKDMYPEIKVILISGYDEFEYAKRAIQLRVDDYILKPIDKSILYKAITKAASEIKKEKDEHLQNKDLLYKLKKADQFLKENEIYKVIENDLDISDKFIEEFFGQQNQNFIVFGIKVHGFYKVVDQRFNGDMHAAKTSIKNIIENLNRENFYFFFSFRREDECILIRYGDPVNNETEEINFANKLRTVLEQYTCMKMSIGLSSIGRNIKELKTRYEEAFYALMHRLLSVTSSRFSYSEVNSRIGTKEIMSKDEEKLIYLAVRNNETIRVKELIYDLFNKLRKNSNVPIYNLQNLHTAFVMLFNKLLTEEGSITGQMDLWLMNNRSLDDFEDLSDFQEEVVKAFDMLTTGIMQRKTISKGSVIERIIEYLGDHYSEDIQLEDISKIYFMNPSYLSQLFKSKKNQTFSQYLTHLRMEKAIMLLEHGNTKISDIAIQVGYNYVSHFIQSFKKVYGITPEQMRKSQRN